MSLQLITHPAQRQVHFQLSNPPSNATSDPEAKGDGSKGVGSLSAVPQPPGWLKAPRLWERFLVMTHGVEREPEDCLK